MKSANTPNNLPHKKAPGKGSGFWIFVAALIILLVIVGVAYKLMSKDEGFGVFNEENRAAENGDGLPNEFYSYVGEIVEIGENKIVIDAKASDNYLTKDSRFNVAVSEETRYTKLGMNEKEDRLKPGESGEMFSRVEASFDDFKVGDKVTVIAFENIKGKAEFTAKQVELNALR